MAVLVPRHRRPAARGDGDLQRLVRPRAGLHHRSATRSMRRMRRPGVEWAHSVQDAAAMVRDYIKWDDTPVSLPHFAESAVRAYKIAMTPPMMPVRARRRQRAAGRADSAEISARAAHPEADASPRRRRAIPARSPKRRGCWSTRENPVIVADRAARTPAGMTLLVELAETLQAPVVDQGGRMNFPTRHPLNQTRRRAAADRRGRRHPRPRAHRLLGHASTPMRDQLAADVAVRSPSRARS